VSEPNELDQLFTEIMDSLRAPDRAQVRGHTSGDDARIGINPIEIRLAERKEIQKRVAQFKAHQQRLIKDHEDYAAAVLLRIRATLADRR
jgi:hypothetical protein